MSKSSLRTRLGELETTPLRIRARTLAEGLFGGLHRADRKGSGIEFAGHRPYTPGDDLRHLDRHALLRHGRHLIREFHTETERTTHLVVDATASMLYCSSEAKESPRKVDHALLLAATLAYAVSKVGDPVGLTIVDDRGHRTLPARPGTEHFERVIAMLEEVQQPRMGKDDDRRGQGEQLHLWRWALSEIGARLPRGSQVFVLSDLLDFEEALIADLVALCTRRRRVVGIQVLDPAELSFPFRGAVRLRDSESRHELETEADAVRTRYLTAMEEHRSLLSERLRARGGRLERTTTDEDGSAALRRAVQERM